MRAPFYHPTRRKIQKSKTTVLQGADSNGKASRKARHGQSRPRGENVVDLMDALRQSIGKGASSPAQRKDAQGIGWSEGNVDAYPGQRAKGKRQRKQRKSLRPSNETQPSIVANREGASREAATACSEATPGGGSWRAASSARSRAWGSLRSLIQPCSSHSRIAPASRRTDLAHPSTVRNAGRRSFIINIASTPRGTTKESLGPCVVPRCDHRAG